MIQLLVAADHPAVGAALMALLAAEDDIDVAGTSGTDLRLVDLAERLRVDMVLMDLRFGGGTHWRTTIRKLRGLAPKPYVLVLTGDEESAAAAGASGCLPGTTPTWEIVPAVRAAFEEHAMHVAPPMVGRMRASARQMSQRELEILRLVSEGMTNREISQALRLSESTVKSHLGHAFVKLDVSTRTAAVARARARGLIG
jgi:DNA-binding NarL/FixJ family response regulator